MFQIQTRPSPRLWIDNRAGEPTSQQVFAPYNRLAAYWPLTGYNGALDLYGAKPSLLVLSNSGATYDDSGIHDRGILVGSAVFTSAAFMGRNDFAGGLLPPVGESFTWLLWVQFSTLDGGAILSYQTGATVRYQLSYEGSATVDSRLTWLVNGASDTVWATTLGTPVINRWYLIECYYDAPSARAGIRIKQPFVVDDPDYPAADEVAVTGGFNRASANLRFGATTSTPGFRGRMACAGLWHRRLNALELTIIAGNHDANPTTPNDYPGALTGDYDWEFAGALPGSGQILARIPAAPVPSDCYASGNPRIVGFTDNTGGAYAHEIWRDDGDGWFILTTLINGVTEYQDDTAITETSELGTEGGDTFQPEHDTTFLRFGTEVQSRYKVRAIGFGDPSEFSNEFDPGTTNLIATEGDQPLTTEGGEPAILE